MTAKEIVEAILSESVFVGNNGQPKGYYGIVDSHGAVRAEYGDNLGQEDHSYIGHNPSWHRWRYATNRAIPLVHWTTDPSEDPGVEEVLEDWLARKGFKVAGHTRDYNLWRGL